MENENLKIALTYYDALNKKDISTAAQYLHDDAVCVSPMAEVLGKEAFIKAIEGFMKMLKNVNITSRFANGNEAIVVYDLHCIEPIGSVRASALFTFENGLIKRNELFYDARKFDAFMKDIFDK